MVPPIITCRYFNLYADWYVAHPGISIYVPADADPTVLLYANVDDADAGPRFVNVSPSN